MQIWINLYNDVRLDYRILPKQVIANFYLFIYCSINKNIDILWEQAVSLFCLPNTVCIMNLNSMLQCYHPISKCVNHGCIALDKDVMLKQK